MKEYWRARSYMRKLDPINYVDLCHDAFLSYWKTSQTNLFEQPPRLIVTVLKRTAFNYWKQKRWQRNGVIQGSRLNVTFNSEGGEELAHKANYITPYDELIANELLERYNKIRNRVVDARAVFTGNVKVVSNILDLRKEGYTNKEISEELSVSKALITYYINKTELNSLNTA